MSVALRDETAEQQLVAHLENVLSERIAAANGSAARISRKTALIDLAREIGISEAMIRALLNRSSAPGANTLGALIVWDPSLEPLLVEHLRERGRELHAGDDR